MDESRIQSALLGWIITLAITISVLLRRDKDVRQKLFILLCGNLTLYYFSDFLFHLLGMPWIERLSLAFATLIPLGGIFFFKSFNLTQRRIRLIRVAVFLAISLIAVIIYPSSLKPAVGPAILAYVVGFMLVALLDLNVQARTAATRVDAARIRYLAGGGFFVLSLQVVDKAGHVFDIYIPPLSLAMTLLYLYFISQSIVRYRILDLYEMLGRLAVLSLMGFFLAIIYFALIHWVGTGKGFFLNAFLASLIILLLFDPLREFVEQKISDFFFGERLFLEQKVADLRFKLAHVINTETMVDVLLAGLEDSRRITHASLFLFDAHGRGYDLQAAVGPSPDLDRVEAAVARRYFRTFAKGGSLVAANLESRRERSLQAGKAETTDDINESLNLLKQLKADVVLFLDGEQDLLGFLCVKDDRINDAFSVEEVNSLAGLAAQAAITVENSQLYQQMKERDRLAALGEMSAGLAHEIRNPLGAIKAAAQFIEEVIAEDDENEDSEYLGIIVEEVNRLNRVVNDFLSYARPSSGIPAKLNVNDILQRTLQVVEAGRRSHLEIVTEYGIDLPGVFIDGERLHQVFLNLIINAEQAMIDQDNAHLEIVTKLRKLRRMQRGLSGADYANFVEVRFADNGPGIEPGVLQNIFIPFFTTKSKGSGLGLSVCQRLIRDAGGEIEVRSQLGSGSIFTVVLPVAIGERDSVSERTSRDSSGMEDGKKRSATDSKTHKKRASSSKKIEGAVRRDSVPPKQDGKSARKKSRSARKRRLRTSK
ncbi:MAG: hypothetical protein JXX29_06025 [Deltaproteobacteria bacterium]|nr:hypothetical protein [Deltaproteobacteria bacterium]MBN2671207.1 hypothetical protein [Deltaproteobacteria bacterium]